MTAREFFSAENLGEFTVTSNTVWGSACTLSPTLASADYIVFWTVELTNQSNTTADAEARVTVGGTVVATMNSENRSTSEWASYSGFSKITGSGSPLTIELQVKAETSGNSIVCRNRRLTVLRMGSSDHYVESIPRQAVTAGGTTTWAEVLSTSFTPAAGDYLVLAHSMSDNYATTTSVYGKFSWDGTPEADTEFSAAGHAEIAAGQKNVIPLNKLRVYSEATGGVSRTVKWLGRSNQNGFEVGFAQNRLLILKLSDFPAAHSAWLSETAWVEGAIPTETLSITPTVSANPHLLLASWYVNNTSSTNNLISSVLDDSDDTNDAASTVARAFSTNSSRAQGMSFGGIRSYAAGPRKIAITLNSAASGDWVELLPSSAFIALDLGADVSTSPVTSSPGAGAISTAGFAPSIVAGQSSSSAPGAGSLSLTGYAPSLVAGQSAVSSPAAGSLSATGLAPTISAAQSSTSFPTTGDLTINGLPPSVTAARSATSTPDLGGILVTGFVPSVGGGVAASVVVGIGSLAISGQAPAVQSAAIIASAAGTAALLGLAPTVVAAQSMTVSVGATTLSTNGQPPIASAAVTASPTAASGSLSGHEPNLVAGVAVEPAPTPPSALPASLSTWPLSSSASQPTSRLTKRRCRRSTPRFQKLQTAFAQTTNPLPTRSWPHGSGKRPRKGLLRFWKRPDACRLGKSPRTRPVRALV
jgi:hypothetical protein